MLITGLTLSVWAFRPAHQPSAEVAALGPSTLVWEWPTVYQETVPDGDPIAEKDLARLSSEFGMRKHPSSGERLHHNGIDLAAPKGTPILAAGDGEVVEAELSGEGYGNRVKIKHGDEYSTFYAHMQDVSVKVGERVTKGQQIGTVGNSGESFGSHLHYEVIKNGEHVDPAKYLPMVNNKRVDSSR
ncbi:MAG TPA: hypothetical protein DCE41_21395 [Cytophagales bacterium]|nr:hypothetical protein [Cytophagales bacterium]